MKSKKNVALLLTGTVLGASLTMPAAHAVAEFVQAQRTPHPIYVDGKQVEMETYAIEGSNYVKLRDIGQAVGFEVYWDGSAAQIVSGKPYTGQPPIQNSSPAPVLAAQDHITEVNPAAFTPKLTREMYLGLRSALLNHREMAAGTYPPVSLGNMENDDYWELYRSFKLTDILESLGSEYSYTTTQQRDGTVNCMVNAFEPISDAVKYARPFVSTLTNLPQREQVEKIVWYICDHLTYNVNSNSGPTSELFVDGTVIEGKCETYAEWLKLLCEQAGIPCVKLRSEDHAWNCVYVDGAWWDVDACWDDENKRIEGDPSQVVLHRQQAALFHTPGSWSDEHHQPCNPDSVRFAKEFLAPGSTK